MFTSKLKNYDQKIKSEHEKIKKEFLDILNRKDNDLATISKKTDEANNSVWNYKNREIEI